MDFNDLAVFRMAKTKMDWIAQRQKVLAQNVANADTPEYRARDLKEPDFKRMALDAIEKQVPQTVTNPGHIKAALPDSGPFREFHDRHTWESSIDDNPVVVEEQVQKIARSKSQYELALRLIGKNITMLRTALGRSGG
jgi:flagellar basal-body rod protein FlgB